MRSPVRATAEPANSRQMADARRIVFMDCLPDIYSSGWMPGGWTECCILDGFGKANSPAVVPLPAGDLSG
jgi:hypothetical protein